MNLQEINELAIKKDVSFGMSYERETSMYSVQLQDDNFFLLRTCHVNLDVVLSVCETYLSEYKPLKKGKKEKLDKVKKPKKQKA